MGGEGGERAGGLGEDVEGGVLGWVGVRGSRWDVGVCAGARECGPSPPPK